MAVALDAALGTHAGPASGTNVLSTGAAVASGAHIIMVVGWFHNGVSTVAVTGGSLTWTEDAVLRAGSLHISVQRAPAPSGLASSTSLTATFTGATPDSLLGATSFTGIDTVGTVVGTPATNSGSTAAWTAALSSTAGNAIVGGAFMDGAATSNTPAGTSVESFDFNSAGQTETATGAYKLSVAGADSIDGTFGAPATWISAVVCYKAASAATAATNVVHVTVPFMSNGRI